MSAPRLKAGRADLATKQRLAQKSVAMPAKGIDDALVFWKS